MDGVGQFVVLFAATIAKVWLGGGGGGNALWGKSVPCICRLSISPFR